jgi:hypothetical protein
MKIQAVGQKNKNKTNGWREIFYFFPHIFIQFKAKISPQYFDLHIKTINCEYKISL